MKAIVSKIILCSASPDRCCNDFCRDAKVSVLNWDAKNHMIATTSLHSFEGDATASASLPASPYGPRLLADPQVPLAARQLEHLQSISSSIIACLNTGTGTPAVLAQEERVSDCKLLGRSLRHVCVQGRCAAVLLGHNNVAILPAMTTDILDEMMLGAGSAANQNGLPTTIGNSCILRLAKHGITEVTQRLVLQKSAVSLLVLGGSD